MQQTRNSTALQATIFVAAALVTLAGSAAMGCADETSRVIRFATFNAALNRAMQGQLIADLRGGDDAQARKIAEIIQWVRPQVLLINEFDYDAGGEAMRLFQEDYLNASHHGQAPIRYRYHFSGPVNTGVPTGYDLDRDGRSDGPGDAYGFGRFPGQYGMVVYSMLPIERERVRTFQRFRWKDMPAALAPRIEAYLANARGRPPEGRQNKDKALPAAIVGHAAVNKPAAAKSGEPYAEGVREREGSVSKPVEPNRGRPYYTAQEWAILRLSSKSHWDIPLRTSLGCVHFLVCHPTPPTFDGPEDRNGRRNHDEVRFFADYIDANRATYIYDDRGGLGGLDAGARFVIAGDMNADPVDGQSAAGSIAQLLAHPRVAGDCHPASMGGSQQAQRQGKSNLRHRGDPALDTADFGDRRAGNLRVDYVLPSRTLKVVDAGVFWPRADQPGYELVSGSDHRLVWVDVDL